MKPNTTNEPQDLKKLKKRYDELHKKKIRAETERASSERLLVDLQRKARERYGTDDLDALQTLLEEWERENEERRSAYQTHLDELEAKLAEVEAQYADETP